jgi:hypothetical protein
MIEVGSSSSWAVFFDRPRPRNARRFEAKRDVKKSPDFWSGPFD